MATVSPTFKINVKCMAGDLVALRVSAETTVGEVKRRIYEQCSEFIVRLQVLSEIFDDGKCTVLANDSLTLGAYGVVDERTLCVVELDGFRGGVHLRSHCVASRIGANPVLDFCVFPDGKRLVLMTDERSSRSCSQFTIRIVSAADCSHISHINTSSIKICRCFCLSRAGDFLYLLDSLNRCVEVHAVSDTEACNAIRTFVLPSQIASNSFEYRMCLSLDDDLLYFCDQRLGLVITLRSLDGAFVGAFGSIPSPTGLCISHNGELMFVADSSHHCICVFRTSDSSHVRTIGSQGHDVGQFNWPCAVCLSPDGEWLVVADVENLRVQAVRASDGALGHIFATSTRLQFESRVHVSPDGKELFVSSSNNILVYTAS